MSDWRIRYVEYRYPVYLVYLRYSGVSIIRILGKVAKRRKDTQQGACDDSDRSSFDNDVLKYWPCYSFLYDILPFFG